MRMSIRNIAPMIGMVAILFGVTPAQAQQTCDIITGCASGPEPLYCGCSVPPKGITRTMLRAACDEVADATGHRSGVLRPPNIHDITAEFASPDQVLGDASLGLSGATRDVLISSMEICTIGSITGDCSAALPLPEDPVKLPLFCLGAGTVGSLD